MTPLALALAGLAAMPLAMLALPLYLHLPALYARDFGLALSSLGLLLFATRLLDTALDPWLGRWQDRLPAPQLRRAAASAAVAALAGWCWLLWPQLGWPLWPQLALALLLVYVAHGWLSIALLRYGAALWPTPAGRARVAAWREAWGLIGVLLAAALPAWWTPQQGELAALQRFLWVLLPLSLLAAVAACYAPSVPVSAPPAASAAAAWWRDRTLRAAAVVLLFNAVAMAIPATLLNFYLADVLQAAAHSGVFLLLYFLAAGLSLPAWVRLADRIGKVRAWQYGMALAVLGFAPVPWLAGGDIGGFAVVCLLTGVALGADLAFASALIADALGARVQQAGGAVFGVVSMLNKLALALAAGVALPLAQAVGYVPGSTAGGLLWLYAGLPALFKLMAWGWLAYRYPAQGAA